MRSYISCFLSPLNPPILNSSSSSLHFVALEERDRPLAALADYSGGTRAATLGLVQGDKIWAALARFIQGGSVRHLFAASLCIAVAAIALVGMPSSAEAAEGRLIMGAGAGVTRPGSPNRQLGGGAQFGFDLSFGDFLGLQAGVDGAYHPAANGRELPAVVVSDLFLGARYNFDVFKYVPYVSLGLVGYLNAPPVGAPDSNTIAPGAGAKLAFGLYYRPRREWSFGGQVELHGAAPALSDFSVYSAALFQVGYHWRL